jgi:outer membrane protein assembly factor BamA
LKYFTLIFFFLFNSFYIYACETGKLPIGHIDYSGLVKTKLDVIKRELEFGSGDCVNTEMLNLALQRVRNTNLFTRVDIDVTEKLSAYHIHLTVVERWTLIPIFKVGGGGGVSFFTIGLYDPHIFGRNVEVGVQYESLGGAPSQVVWFRKPRLFGKRLRVGGDAWNVTRNRLIYDQNRNEIGGFTLMRQRVNLFAEYEVIDYLKPYIALDTKWIKQAIKVSQIRPKKKIFGMVLTHIRGGHI